MQQSSDTQAFNCARKIDQMLEVKWWIKGKKKLVVRDAEAVKFFKKGKGLNKKMWFQKFILKIGN